MSSSRFQDSVQFVIVPFALAGVALLLGVVVYVLDRSPDRVYFLSEWLSFINHQRSHASVTTQFFGDLGYYLPTLLHTYAFILLTIVVITPYQNYRRHILWICLFWLVIESLFEIAQIKSIAQAIASWVPTSFSSIPVLENIPSYFIAGTFDVVDLMSIFAGTLFAYLTINCLHYDSKYHLGTHQKTQNKVLQIVQDD